MKGIAVGLLVVGWLALLLWAGQRGEAGTLDVTWSVIIAALGGAWTGWLLRGFWDRDGRDQYFDR